MPTGSLILRTYWSVKYEKYRFQTLCEKYRFQTTRVNNNMSSSSDREYYTTTRGGIISSTPVNGVPPRNYTTSLSQISTTSSLSGDRVEDGLKSQTARKRIKKIKKNKEIPNKRRPIQLNDTEQETTTEWSTQSEEEVSREDILEEEYDDYINLFDDPEKENDAYINLFDPCTPEKIRDAPVMCQSPLRYSPILRSSKRFLDNIEQYDKLLPTNILSKIPEDPEEMNKNGIKLNRSNNAKTYKRITCKGNSKEKESQNLLGIYRNVTYSPPCFSMSDLLWEEFVNKNREEMPEYLASCSAQVYKQSNFLRKHPDIPPKFESSPHLPGSVCFRGYSTRETKKWITNVTYYPKEETKVHQTKARKRNKRKQKKRTVTLKSMNKLTINKDTTVYDVDDEIDVEFETGGRDGKRMSFSEFCQKRKFDKC